MSDAESLNTVLISDLSTANFRTTLIDRIVVTDRATLDAQYDALKGNDDDAFWANWPSHRRLNRGHVLNWMYVNIVHVDNTHFCRVHFQPCSATDAQVTALSLKTLQSAHLDAVVQAVLTQSYDRLAKCLSVEIRHVFTGIS